MSRPSWSDVWIDVAHAVAKRSLCSRAQVGAVITDPQNRIISTGYNGPPSGFNHYESSCASWCDRSRLSQATQGYDNCPSLHAEANALLAADRSLWADGTIYVTSSVCADCAKLIANSGLKHVVVASELEDRSYRSSRAGYHFLGAVGIGVEVLERRRTNDNSRSSSRNDH